MILLIIFIVLLVAFYMFRHFENRRDARNTAHHEKRSEAFTDLLKTLTEKETTGHTENKKENI